jgi:hypothetical protein
MWGARASRSSSQNAEWETCDCRLIEF